MDVYHSSLSYFFHLTVIFYIKENYMDYKSCTFHYSYFQMTSGTFLCFYIKPIDAPVNTRSTDTRSAYDICHWAVGGPERRDCPHHDSYHWKCLARIKNCSSDTDYHCAKDLNGNWIEICDKFKVCHEGLYARICLSVHSILLSKRSTFSQKYEYFSFFCKQMDIFQEIFTFQERSPQRQHLWLKHFVRFIQLKLYSQFCKTTQITFAKFNHSIKKPRVSQTLILLHDV